MPSKAGTFRVGKGLLGIFRKGRLLILNQLLEEIRSIAFAADRQQVLNSKSENRDPSPYICTATDRIVTFAEPVSGTIVYQFECEQALCYAGVVVLAADGATVRLIAIDFKARSNRVLWTRTLEVKPGQLSPTRVLIGNDVVVCIADLCSFGTEVAVLDRKTGNQLWKKAFKVDDPIVALSSSILTLSALKLPPPADPFIVHVEIDSGDSFEQKKSVFAENPEWEDRIVQAGDDYLIGLLRKNLVIVDFVTGSISIKPIESGSEPQVGIAFREQPDGPIKVKLAEVSL